MPIPLGEIKKKLDLVTAVKTKFSIKNFFSKCEQIRSFPRVWSHLPKKSLIKNFIFCAMSVIRFIFEKCLISASIILLQASWSWRFKNLRTLKSCLANVKKRVFNLKQLSKLHLCGFRTGLILEIIHTNHTYPHTSKAFPTRILISL